MQLLEQLAHAGVLDDAAVVDDADVAAQLLGFFQVVRGEDDGDALTIQFGEERPHRAAQLDVHARCRLVEDQQARLVDQRAGDHQPALHAAGEHSRGHVTLVPQPQLMQIFFGTLPGDLRRDAVVARLGDEDIEGLFELVEVELLRHHAQAALESGRIAIQVVAEHVHRAAALVHQRGKNADGGGLAGAVGAEQGEEIAFGNVQVDALEGLEAVAIGLGQLPDGQSVIHIRSAHNAEGSS
ncbi:hypothetical protein SSTU70S_05805 [Stutzerimonas stutzeri]